MKCPLDQTDLLITERQGVEIDYCPTCRGVWLDRGELDKLIERAEAFDNRDRSRDQGSRDQNPREDYDRDERGYQPPYQAPPARPSAPDIAGMVGDVLKKKFDERGRNDGYRGDDHRGGYDPHYKKKKKGGLLGDLFDF